MSVRLNILLKDRTLKVNYIPFSANDDLLSVNPKKEVNNQKLEGKQKINPITLYHEFNCIRLFVGVGSLLFRKGVVLYDSF